MTRWEANADHGEGKQMRFRRLSEVQDEISEKCGPTSEYQWSECNMTLPAEYCFTSEFGAALREMRMNLLERSKDAVLDSLYVCEEGVGVVRVILLARHAK